MLAKETELKELDIKLLLTENERLLKYATFDRMGKRVYVQN